MIKAQSGDFLHTASLQSVASSASLSHIELDATKSPLALLARTCSLIGKSDPFSSTSSSSDSKDSRRLKICNISFYPKPVEEKDSEPSADVLRNTTSRPFAVCSPKVQDEDQNNDREGNKHPGESCEMIRSGHSEINSKTRHGSERSSSLSDTSVVFSPSSSLGLRILPFSALPLPPFPRSCASFPQPVLPALNNKPGTSMCGDPYCLGYHCSACLKSTFPLLYPSLSLPSSSTSAFTIFPHGMMHPHELQPCVFNSVSASPSEISLPSSAASHTHVAQTLRNSHHTLGLATRYHPYIKNPLPTPPNPYYSLHGLYGLRLEP